MKSFPCSVIAVSCAVSSVFGQKPAVSPAQGENPAPTLRARISEVAGALGNEGFKMRDGAWSGILDGGKAQRLAVDLFSGNEYWFCAATSSEGSTPSLTVRDPSGKQLETVPYEGQGIAAAGVTAPVTGRYIIEIKGSSPGTRDFCLLYFFK